jgi:hypothetical protein
MSLIQYLTLKLTTENYNNSSKKEEKLKILYKSLVSLHDIIPKCVLIYMKDIRICDVIHLGIIMNKYMPETLEENRALYLLHAGFFLVFSSTLKIEPSFFPKRRLIFNRLHGVISQKI